MSEGVQNLNLFNQDQKLEKASSNFDFDVFCYRRKFLFYNLVSRNLKLKYRRSFFGIFWTVLVPLFTSFTFYWVFQFIMKVQMPNYLLFVVSSVLPWAAFSQGIVSGMESIVQNQPLVTKVPVPVQVFPLVEVSTLFINFLFSLPVIFGVALFTGAPITLYYPIFLFLIFLLFLQSYGFALVLSILFVYFRDLRHLIGVVLQIWFYGTPLLYEMNMVPEKHRYLLMFNPCTFIFRGIHDVLVDGKFPGWSSLLGGLGWTMVIFLFGYLIFMKNHKKVVELL
ncbi:MAG: ABC transporter permease [Bdellovibrionales bacterium]|nr:ABC transporter permease [Bdellovibrionales bacterium]